MRQPHSLSMTFPWAESPITAERAEESLMVDCNKADAVAEERDPTWEAEGPSEPREITEPAAEPA